MAYQNSLLSKTFLVELFNLKEVKKEFTKIGSQIEGAGYAVLSSIFIFALVVLQYYYWRVQPISCT